MQRFQLDGGKADALGKRAAVAADTLGVQDLRLLVEGRCQAYSEISTSATKASEGHLRSAAAMQDLGRHRRCRIGRHISAAA